MGTDITPEASSGPATPRNVADHTAGTPRPESPAAGQENSRSVRIALNPLRLCVYVAAPVSGDLVGNIQRAKDWYAWLVEHEPDVAFVMSWLADVATGDDSNPERRERGLRDCEVIASRCDGIVMVGGRRSVGMLRELAACRDAGGWVADLTVLGNTPPQEWRLNRSPLEVGIDIWRVP